MFIAATDTLDTVPVAELFSYILTVSNAGPSKTTNMTIQNMLPEGAGGNPSVNATALNLNITSFILLEAK